MIPELVISMLPLAPLAGGDTLLQAATVTAVKQAVPLERVASPVSFVRMEDIRGGGLETISDLSSLVPGLTVPKYGASLTSTIYLRGFGSRMDNPVMGLYLDDIPVLDKNAYDTDFLDIRSATMLRGPQGTLYGRNSMAGMLSLRTLSALDYQGVRMRVEYGTANTLRANASVYSGNHALSAGFRHSDGYTMNEYKGTLCDPYDGGSIRWRWDRRLSGKTVVGNILQASFSKEGGFAYGRYEDGYGIHPVSYNDEGSYGRFSLLEGFKLQERGEKVHLDASASVQLLSDDMRMDQDFTSLSVFTLQQRQRSGALTAEVVARPSSPKEHWNPMTGVFLFGRYNMMDAPVNFKYDGIQTLILDNANSHIPPVIGRLEIPDPQLPILSSFDIGSWGAAIFHESVFSWGRWQLTAGLRIDYEGASMGYDCSSTMNYQFVPIMTGLKAFRLPYTGSIGHSCIELLPKLNILLEVAEGFFLYGTASKGYRAGGFNTQIFSDILQNKMMNGLMEDLGVYPDIPAVSVGAGNTEYDPEEAWNTELGIRLSGSQGLSLEASVYRMDGINQQLTVFPPGMSTGRMMTNAGKSRSIGAEAEVAYRGERISFRLSGSRTDARFVSYKSGDNDYSGLRIPYVPCNTLYSMLQYRQPLGRERYLSLMGDLRGNGPVCWNEDNTLEEDFHMVPGARVSFLFTKGEIYLRGENLTGSRLPLFYFKSVGREFFSLSAPTTLAIGLYLNL